MSIHDLEMNESKLIIMFEMLIERLSTIEEDVKSMKAAVKHDNAVRAPADSDICGDLFGWRHGVIKKNYDNELPDIVEVDLCIYDGMKSIVSPEWADGSLASWVDPHLSAIWGNESYTTIRREIREHLRSDDGSHFVRVFDQTMTKSKRVLRCSAVKSLLDKGFKKEEIVDWVFADVVIRRRYPQVWAARFGMIIIEVPDNYTGCRLTRVVNIINELCAIVDNNDLVWPFPRRLNLSVFPFEAALAPLVLDKAEGSFRDLEACKLIWADLPKQIKDTIKFRLNILLKDSPLPNHKFEYFCGYVLTAHDLTTFLTSM